ncbi:DNA polymerase epsilon subunit 2-like [Limulus polyphemus]|uniref:DNA polymerase epsilon subunit n=1 Tax=Limulus polyphemus TaxID=6850 RepID=A0ABM1TFL1_LIMPO|nr:DNA polymerase epsilon subunit 2-like [Limulus polyphemus]
MSLNLKNQAFMAFQISGLTLRSDAGKYLLSLLSPIKECERGEWLTKIVEAVQRQPLTSSFVDKTVIEKALKEFTDPEKEEAEAFLNIISAYSVPALAYDPEMKRFTSKKDAGSINLHSDANTKAFIFLQRYDLVYQRTIRHSLFSPPVITGLSPLQPQSFTLKPVEFLLGTSSKQGNLIVLGMLTQMKEGKYFLEDPTGAVPLDLSKTVYKGGLFTENSFVLAEGVYEDSIFHVSALGFPPPEPASTTLQHFGKTNFFGGPHATSVRTSKKLKSLEENNSEAMFIFLSDVWLDKIEVLQKLKILLAGFSEMPPTCFVLMGNFVSVPQGISHSKIVKDCFEKLANMISEFPLIVQNSQFVFVPGPSDPGLTTILPRPSIPGKLVEDFCNKIPNSVFATNPCRIQYCSQEITVFREDMVAKMCRSCVYMPWEHEEQVNVPNLFVKTLVANAHLCPLPLNVAPVYWEYDHSLWLYPLPDIVVCGDKYDPFCVTNNDCTFINPGSFPHTDFSFKVYLPSTRQVEDSQITDVP